MLERDGYIPGVPCWIDTSQPDPEAAAEFYARLFGWDIADVMPPDSPGKYLIGRIRAGDVAAIGSIPEGAPPMAMWNTYIWVDSADETAAKVKAAGGRIVMDPFDVMDAGRMAVVSDPEGAVFSLWQANRHKGARIVNEPGALNFNNLATRNLEHARAFYGEVFGWEVLDLGSGGKMWMLPGYADHLESLDPGFRKRMAESGAPEGFAEVVAGIVPLGDAEQDVPANWGVAFSVEDADATAALAYELGGRVIAPPFDAPWVRMAVLGDPAGATFTASQFMPENKDLAGPVEPAASAA